MREFVDTDGLVAATRALVAAESCNPPGGERAAADVAIELLRPLGATFEEVEPAPGRVSLVARIGDADGERPVLLVNGHLDTVPVVAGAWAHDPFAGEVVDGRIYGRGTADMKGGIAAAIEALHVLRRAGRRAAGDIVLHLVADEETGGELGTRALLDRGLIAADACLDPEPTGLAVGVAERGLLQAVVEVTGVPAHASEPRRGVSAVEKAAKVVLALHGVDWGEAHPLLGRPSCNVGVIDGGTAYNVVAERCVLHVDRRVLPGATAGAVVDAIRRRIDSIDDHDLRYDVRVHMFGEASELDASHPFVEVVQRAREAALGERAPVIGMQFSTDARFVRNQAGVPAVVCGPGELDQAHRVDESVAVDALVDAAAFYAELYATFA